MKGYKFHRAKLTAMLALGQLCFRLPDQNRKLTAEAFEKIRHDLGDVLATPLQILRAAAAAAVADLCRSSTDFSQLAKEVLIACHETILMAITLLDARLSSSLSSNYLVPGKFFKAIQNFAVLV